MLTDDELKAAIIAELDELKDDAVLRGESNHPDWYPAIDSLAVINICVRIEEETGVAISEDCVPVGGFADREACIAVMTQHAKVAMKAAKIKSKQEA